MTASSAGFPTIARDLDLNLLRVFVLVAEGGSVTGAASRLYLTQPAVSAALRRLSAAVGASLFSKHGRGLVLTPRGERLLAETRAPLLALTRAALAPPAFAAETDETTFRLGLGDAFEGLVVPPLLRALRAEAPHQRLVVLPVQFRTIGEAFSSRSVDLAVTVADELPRDVVREDLFAGSFVCLFDPREVHLPVGRDGKVKEDDYFAQEHVIVSYNGDLRGLVEDFFHRPRNVRCSLPAFTHVGAIVEGSPLVATVPVVVARAIQTTQPALRTASLPFAADGSTTELLWPVATEDDAAHRFFRTLVRRIVREVVATLSTDRAPAASSSPPSPPSPLSSPRGAGSRTLVSPKRRKERTR
jgi:LysR family transcriptional regulator, mexEF-oprN operon transcriptional activator